MNGQRSSGPMSTSSAVGDSCGRPADGTASSLSAFSASYNGPMNVPRASGPLMTPPAASSTGGSTAPVDVASISAEAQSDLWSHFKTSGQGSMKVQSASGSVTPPAVVGVTSWTATPISQPTIAAETRPASSPWAAATDPRSRPGTDPWSWSKASSQGMHTTLRTSGADAGAGGIIAPSSGAGRAAEKLSAQSPFSAKALQGLRQTTNELPDDSARRCPNETAPRDFDSSVGMHLVTKNLPPGWISSRDPASHNWYYQDVETRLSTWNAPPQYLPTDWKRVEQEQHSAYWCSKKLEIKFYEHGQAEWQRIIFDPDRGAYWYNAKLNIRFFESDFQT